MMELFELKFGSEWTITGAWSEIFPGCFEFFYING